MDKVPEDSFKTTMPLLIASTITGLIIAYYRGFLFSIVVNSLKWMVISFIKNKYYYKSTGFKDEKYLLQYGLTKINSRRKRL